MDDKRSLSPWIFTTKRCNLSCPYCFVKNENKDMEVETYKKIFDVFVHLFNKGKLERVDLRLSGGEPFLVFDKWKKSVSDFYKKYPDKVSVGIITNLTIPITSEMLEWLKEHNALRRAPLIK